MQTQLRHQQLQPPVLVLQSLQPLRYETSAGKRDEYLTLAEEELMRVDHIASNTLRFYRDPMSVTTADVAELIDSVLLLFDGRISQQQVRVQRELPLGIGIQAPQGELRHVLVNLLGNALGAMPNGCRLIVRARALTGKGGNQCARVTVADTGVGMSAEVKARIFEAFTRRRK